MFIEDIIKRIEELSHELCRKMEMVLIKASIIRRGNGFHIQIIADKTDGITVGECAILHKALVAAINQENLLTDGTFSMEVSSPGVE